MLLKRSQQRFEAQQTSSSPKKDTAVEEIRNGWVPVSPEGPPRSGWEAPRAAHPSPQQEQVAPPSLPRHWAGASFRRDHMAVSGCRLMVGAAGGGGGGAADGAVGVCLEEIRKTKKHRGAG